MKTRREFLGSLALPALASVAARLEALAPANRAPSAVAGDEDYWAEVARAYACDRSIVNLNNGGVSPAPAAVLAAQMRHLQFSNKAPPYSIWRVLEPQKETVRQQLARHWDVSPEELALTRNTSEGLMICQFGIDLQRGDEVLSTDQDYPRMVQTFRQRERREGIVYKQISLPVPAEDDAEVVRRYEAAITPRTKLILVSHMIYLTGQILPVRAIVAMARKHGVPVIVDGAHALAHFAFKLSELDCDYYATSLHKWLFAPIGTGLLYVRRAKIAKLWPLTAADASLDDDIRKFEQIGTHPVAGCLAIANALTFHQAIGDDRKAARLVHLRDYWAKRLAKNPRIHFNTSLKPGFAAGIASFSVDGLSETKIAGWLWRKRRILVTTVQHPSFTGMRVSASVYTTKQELDRFGDAMEHVLEKGLTGD